MATFQHQSLMDQLLSELEHRVTSGVYPVGQRLPSESELAADLGVSRPLVRELLARLRERGYIETLNGRGSFVRAHTSAPMLDAMLRHIELSIGNAYSVDDLYTVRSMIETEAARIAATEASDEDLDVIRKHAAEALEAEGDPERYTVADINFHLAIAHGTKNALFPALLTPIVELVVRGIHESVATYREGMRGGNVGHQKILTALLARDAVGAEAAMGEHLTYSRSTFPETSFGDPGTGIESDST